MTDATDSQISADVEQLINQRINARKQKEKVIAYSTVIIPTIGAIATVVLAMNGFGGSAAEWITLGVMYVLSMIGVEVGYHRCFTHKAFVPNKITSFLLAVFGAWTLEGPPMWWASVHRRHHSNTDQDGDPHSPYGGVIPETTSAYKRFLHSHTLWLFNSESISSEHMVTHSKELYKNQVLFNVNVKYWYWAASGIVLPTVALGLYYMSLEGALLGFLWGGLTRICIGHHAFWSLNSFCHTVGTRPFNTGDKSTNNVVVALLTIGQGWHNNHHAFPSSAKVGLRWWEFDPGWFLIRVLEKCGMVSDVKVPSDKRINSKLKSNQATA